MPASVWTQAFGPFDEEGNPVRFDTLDITEALRGNRPAHSNFCIRAQDGSFTSIEASGIPIVGTDGYRGAMVWFWPAEEEDG